MNKKKTLFDNEPDEDKPNIQLNSDYAKNYETWRRKEELNKTKARYGDVINDEESSDSSSDDEVNDLEVGVLDTNFLQTLSCLKSNDPRIYDQNVKFFNDDDITKPSTSKISKKEKPMTLRDYERKLILEKGGQVEDTDDENFEEDPRANSPTYVEQQKQLKESFKKALQEADSDQEENWGGIFKKKEKSKEQIQKEDNDYVQWLKGQKESLPDDKIETELKPLKDYWHNPKLDSGEKFLRDYILNKKFLENDDENYIPSYEEIVHDSDDGLSEDGEAIREQEEFETKYNYRFEEPDQEFIKRYPRTMENSMRKKDDRRKQKRAEVRERKEREKLQKKEELQRMKAMKRKEIEEKIEKLKEITGNTEVGFNDQDVDGDFDPEEHDRRMQQLFNDEFYGGKEGEQKPEFPDLDEELEIENWDKWKGDDNIADSGPHCEDEDFNMDCDYDPTTAHQNEMLENSKKRKRKRRSKFAEIVSEKKPIFDPNNKTYEEYLDEYYKLDYEDIIGDIPCRFKYRKVVPNDFGLTVEEILAAKDKELNRWCSLKKAVQIRPEHVEKYDVLAYQQKGKNEMLKKKIFHSLYNPVEEENFENPKIKNKTARRNFDQQNRESEEDNNNVLENSIKETINESNDTVEKTKENTTESPVNKKKKIKKKQKHSENNILEISNDQSIENSVNISEKTNVSEVSPKKKVKKRKNSENVNNSVSENNEIVTNPVNNLKKAKKRKNTETSINGNINKKSKKKRKLQQQAEVGDPNSQKKRKNKLNKKNKQLNIGISDERLKAFGINPKKFKNKLKYGGDKKTKQNV